jgi:hypothetical protein
MERIDISYRQKLSKESKAELIERDKRDKTYFNAGRYAAGARDKVAVAAWRKIGEQDII